MYRAHHRHDSALRAAVKVVHPALSTDPEFVDALTRECRQLDALDHPSIVRFRGLIVEDGTYAMILELLTGEDLHQRIGRGPMSPPEAHVVIGKLLEGLAHAHARGVVHRDIKPANVFLCEDGRVKLLDFGIARAADGARATRTGKLVGTLDYMAPERFSGESGAATDVYAAGLVAWELLAGRAAAPDGGLPEKMAWHLTAGPARLDAVDGLQVPTAMADVVAALCDRDGSARPADGAAALARWRQIPTPALPAPRASLPPETVSITREDVARVERQLPASGPRTVTSSLPPPEPPPPPPEPRDPPAPRTPPLRRSTLPRVVAGALGIGGLGLLAVVGAVALPLMRAGDDEPAAAALEAPAESDPLEAEWSALVDRLQPDDAGLREAHAFRAAHELPEALSATVNAWIEEGADRLAATAPIAGTAEEVDTYRVEALAWHPSDGRLAAVGRDGRIHIRAPDGTWSHWTPKADFTRTAVAWSPDGTRLAAARRTGEVDLFDATGALTHTLKGLKGRVLDLVWSPDAIVASGPGVFVWTADGKEVGAVDRVPSQGARVAWGPAGLVAERADNAVARLDGLRLDEELIPPGDDVTALAVGAEVTAARGPKLARQVDEVRVDPPIHALASHGPFLATLSPGALSLRLAFDLERPEVRATPITGVATPTAVALGPAGLAVAIGDRFVHVLTEPEGPAATLTQDAVTGDVTGRYSATRYVPGTSTGWCDDNFDMASTWLDIKNGKGKALAYWYPTKLEGDTFTLTDAGEVTFNDTPCYYQFVQQRATPSEEGHLLTGGETRRDTWLKGDLPSVCGKGDPQKLCSYEYQVTWELH